MLGVAMQALAAGRLSADGLVEGAVESQQGAHEPTSVKVDVLDAAFGFGNLLVVAALAGALWEQERTAKALGAVAVSMLEPVGGMHAQACPAVRGAIGVAWDGIMAVAVERNGSNALPMGHCLIDVPVIEGGVIRHGD